MAIKIYGSNLCPRTLAALAVFAAHKYTPIFINVTGSIGLMKEYVLLRDTNVIFKELLGTDKIGFPYFLLEDGTWTRDATQAFASVGIVSEL